MKSPIEKYLMEVTYNFEIISEDEVDGLNLAAVKEFDPSGNFHLYFLYEKEGKVFNMRNEKLN